MKIPLIDIRRIYYLTSATSGKNKFIIIDQSTRDPDYPEACKQYTVPENMCGLYNYTLQNKYGVPYTELFEDQMKLKHLYFSDKKYQDLLDYLKTRFTAVFIRGGLG